MHGGDLTRTSFDAPRHFSGVRMQQGRVQLDADWNEQLDIQGHRDQVAALDIIGPNGVPKAGGGFRVHVVPDGSDLLLDPGRMWVDGTLCELEAETTTASLSDAAVLTVDTVVLDGIALAVHDWVLLTDSTGNVSMARLAAVDIEKLQLTLDSEPTGLTGELRLTRIVSYTTQPDLIAPQFTTAPDPSAPPRLTLDSGTYLAYLDVFQRTITALEAPEIREVALGGPDTATRSRTVWQLRLLPLADAPADLDCSDDFSQWTQTLDAPTGTMAARADPDEEDVNLCTPTPAGGFTGLENQLYRVQIHDLTGDGRPLIVWSRDNGSVVTAWTGTTGNDLAVVGIGPDGALGFSTDQWVELLDDAHELGRTPGTLVKLLNAEGNTMTIVPGTADGSFNHDDFGGGNSRARRWDSDGPVSVTFDDWIKLERGIQVRFSRGTYRRGDFWLVPARTASADVDWPHDSRQPHPRPLQRPPHGVTHAWCRLALVRASAGQIELFDCRDMFPSLTTLLATDIGVDDTVCAMPGVDTVQEALDQLCRSKDLRRHHRLLHGWGIVNGLQVQCGPNPADTKRVVTVLPGTAIDAQGNDIDLDQPAKVDLMALVEDQPDLLDPEGNGEVCMALQQGDTGVEFPISKYDPKADKPPDLFNGTLLLDFYNDCIKSLYDWLRAELTPGPDDQGPAGPAQQRLAALTNLIAQPINPKSGRHVFLSHREDTLLQEFYGTPEHEGLRQKLSSHTFCAMFDNARVPPPYPKTIEGIDTIFGVGAHTRLRVRPGGREAYSVGAGLSPFNPTGLINRYDLEGRRLVARIDPIAGKEIGPADKLDTGTGAATDVAFSPDGKRIYVTVPTRNEDNTIFRVGDIASDTIQWQPMVTICGVKLVTLAATDQDPEHVYAIGLHKVTGEDNVTQWHGAGLYKINPEQVDPSMSPMPIPDFFPVGHLVITPDGIAVATAVDGDVPVTAYKRLFQIRLPDGTTDLPTIELDASGNDDLTLTQLPEGGSRVYVVVDSGGGKGIEVTNVGLGVVLNDDPWIVQQGPGAVRLLGIGENVAVTSAELYELQLLAADGQPVPEYSLPLQVGPISIATDPKAEQVYVLNYVSNTISVIDRKLLQPDVRFDFAALEAYRKGMLEAFADLLGGFLQYLKDCLFDHFLVRRPEPIGAETLYLACVSIRKREVYRVCNFSRRRYVKSFPTIGYWLSVIPVAPLLKLWFSRIACAVLPEYFSGLSVRDGSEASDRVSIAQLQQLIGWAQASDVLGRVREVRQRNAIFRGAAQLALRRAEPAPPPVGGRRILSSDIVGQPTDNVAANLANRGVMIRREPFKPRIGMDAIRNVAGLFREAQPGDEITLFDEDGTVRYFAVSKSPGVLTEPPSPMTPSTVAAAEEAAPDTGAAALNLAERVTALEQELANLRAQLQRRRQPRRTDPTS
jgi:DNA-binding beta-propeller fold protein YncE